VPARSASFRTPSNHQHQTGTTIEPRLPSESFRTRCFEQADRWFHRLAKLAEALHKGFWLGSLSADDLNVITSHRYAASQHLTSIDHVEGGFFDWEAPLIERYFRKGSRILVAAAGTGREILALRDAGFSADGFECNRSLLAAGRKIFEQLGQSYSVVFCEPDRVPTGPQIYEGVIVGWSAYTHIPTRLRRVRFLQALRGRTLPHSALVMSFFIRNESSRYIAMTYRAGAIFRILFRGRKEPLERGDDLEFSHFRHRFTRDEIEGELQAAGFRMLDYSEQGDAGIAAAVADDALRGRPIT
jgi:hypothetical protein